MNLTPEKKYPLEKKVEEKSEGLVKILEDNFGSLQKMEIEVPPFKKVVGEVVGEQRENYFNEMNKKLEEEGDWHKKSVLPWGNSKDHLHLEITPEKMKSITTETYNCTIEKYLDEEIKEKISTIRSALKQIEEFVMTMFGTYFPGAPEHTKKIVEMLKEHKDVVLRDRKDLNILWGLYKKSVEQSRKDTLKTERGYTYIERDFKHFFAGGDAISKEMLIKYADTIKKDIIECLRYWVNFSKECPVFGVHSDNLILFRTLEGILSVINKNLEELRSLESVNKDDLKPVNLTFNLIYNIETNNNTIMEILNSNFEKLEKELSKIKIDIDETSERSIKKILQMLGYEDVVVHTGLKGPHESGPPKIYYVTGIKHKKTENKKD